MAYDGPATLANDDKTRLRDALSIIEKCRVSAGVRASYCRQLYVVSETGRQDNIRSAANLLWNHLDRLASHLYSPVELNFNVGFENDYPDNILKQAIKVGKLLSRSFKRNNIDTLISLGVFEALRYGGTILKQIPIQVGVDRDPTYNAYLIMPWQFGLYREDRNDLDKQPAMCETILLTMPEVWRRIWHMPDAEKLLNRIRVHANPGKADDQNSALYHQVLSTATLNTGNTGMTRPVPGGIVQINNDPNYVLTGPEISADLVKMHELWVWGEDDWETVQIIEPDILVTRYKRGNLMISGDMKSGLHPYTMIQPNKMHGWAWGRSELIDMVEPQTWLSTACDDLRRLFGLQIDKILGFQGNDGITDELYDQMRGAGYVNTGPGGTIADLTPKIPEQALPLLQWLMTLIDRLGGFDNMLNGQGQPGVRSGMQTDTLLKTASPRLRDRALLIERQVSQAADLHLHLMEAKDSDRYWTDGTSPETIAATRFLLKDLPDDREVDVDSHSTSPIFADNHQSLIAFGLKAGFADAEYAIDNLSLPHKDTLKHRLKQKELQQQALMKDLLAKDPEALEKILAKKGGKH